jgi:hypothetical protein
MGKVLVAVLLIAGMVGGHLINAMAADERTQQALVDQAVLDALTVLEGVEAHYAERRTFPAAVAGTSPLLKLAVDADTGTVSATYRDDYKDAELNAVYPVRERGIQLTPIVRDGHIKGWRCTQTLGYAKAASCREGQDVSARRTGNPGA